MSPPKTVLELEESNTVKCTLTLSCLPSLDGCFQIVQRIMEAHANVRDLGLQEAKMAYIKAWQSLPEFGITYFRIRMANSKKEVRNWLLDQLCGRVGLGCLSMSALWRGGAGMLWALKGFQRCLSMSALWTGGAGMLALGVFQKSLSMSSGFGAGWAAMLAFNGFQNY